MNASCVPIGAYHSDCTNWLQHTLIPGMASEQCFYSISCDFVICACCLMPLPVLHVPTCIALIKHCSVAWSGSNREIVDFLFCLCDVVAITMAL